ncbi:MAG: WD40/YVTN/BNR-like repeat-containing protein, partial [Treponema sp.]
AAFVDGKLRAACIDAENLIVQQLKIDSDKQSNQDFEAYFDKNRGLQIRNKGADILKIDPKTGEAFFTGKVQAGAVELADKGVFIRNGEVTVENKGWKAAIRPCSNGVELAILGGDGGNMTKKQLWTYISGGILNLFVLGSVTSCGGMYQGNTGAVKNGWEKKDVKNRSFFYVAANGNKIIATSGNFKDLATSLDNGNTWNVTQHPLNKNMYHITNNGNTWLAIHDNKTILQSVDNGNTWIAKPLNINNSFNISSLRYESNMLIATGGALFPPARKAAIAKSHDNGTSWTIAAVSNKYDSCQDIAFNGSTWIAVGTNRMIARSVENGTTWVDTPPPRQQGFVLQELHVAVANGAL